MLATDNPASRLHGILEELSLQTSPKNNNKAVVRQGDAWSRVLKIDINDKELVIKGIFSVNELANEVMQLVINHELDEELYSNELSANIDKIIHPISLHAGWENQRLKITPTLLQALLFCSEKFKELNVYQEISAFEHADEIQKLITDVEGLLALISCSKLPPELRSMLMQNAMTLRESLILYYVKGDAGLKEAFHSIAGFVAVNEKQINAAAVENQEAKEVLQKLAKVAAAIDKVTEVGDKWYKRYLTLRSPGKALLKLLDDFGDENKDTQIEHDRLEEVSADTEG